MTAIANQLRLSRHWQNAGIPAEQADKMVEALSEELGQGIATKADLAELKAELLKWMFAQTFVIIGVAVALKVLG
jgi:hypothetical protein